MGTASSPHLGGGAPLAVHLEEEPVAGLRAVPAVLVRERAGAEQALQADTSVCIKAGCQSAVRGSGEALVGNVNPGDKRAPRLAPM